jgi:hypothetical protein
MLVLAERAVEVTLSRQTFTARVTKALSGFEKAVSSLHLQEELSKRLFRFE